MHSQSLQSAWPCQLVSSSALDASGQLPYGQMESYDIEQGEGADAHLLVEGV